MRRLGGSRRILKPDDSARACITAAHRHGIRVQPRNGPGDLAVSEIALSQHTHRPTIKEAVSARVRQRLGARAIAAAFSIALIVAVLSPMQENFRERPRDSFPLSYYPMFTLSQDDLNEQTYVVGFDASGKRYTIRYSYISPGGRLVRVRSDVRRQVQQGLAGHVCGRTSLAIAQRNPRSLRPVVTLQVVTGTYSLSEYLDGNKTPRSEIIHAACQIARGSV